MARGGDRLDDPRRVAALRASGLLDRTTDHRLRSLCESAAQLVRAPASLLNVIDEEQQTTVAGWPDGQMSVKAQDTACTEVIVSREVLAISNTLLHPVVCDMPFVVIGGWRSYLGVPIFHEGYAIGSLCVVDVVVRDWTYWEVQGLKSVAALAGLSVQP